MTREFGRVRTRYVAPAGAPIGPGTLLAWMGRLAGRQDHTALLQSAIEALVGVRSCHVFSTGRAGLTVLLRALRRVAADSSRDEVIIPSYTCYSVAASVVKAGLVPRLVDVDPDTLDFDQERLRAADCRRVLAIVATNLYGMPNDLPALVEFARERSVYVIDDAAQALGARLGGRFCGTFGDAGLYSFDKGKNVSAIDGGAIVTNDTRLAEALARETPQLPAPSTGDLMHAMLKLAAYALLLPPRLYWIPNSLPMLGLGRTIYDTQFPLARQSGALAALASVALERLTEFTARRRENAEAILAQLRQTAGLKAIRPLLTAEPVYLRLPILFERTDARDAALSALNEAGIGATASYPASIADIPELRGKLRGDDREARGGRMIARCVLTLPTHPYVTNADTARTVDTINRVLDRRPSAHHVSAQDAPVKAATP